uniref:RNase III domain-containing protein n=1 Tax=viral metagenome TaxID=1070528 RepID=A0A6C0J7Y2_9ZZZZ
MYTCYMSRYIKRQNPNNKWITKNAVEDIMKENGFFLKVNDISIYQQAFIHRSYLKSGNIEPIDTNCIPLQQTCNESYEFLGDTILNSVVGTYLYDRYNHENEGFLTKTRTKMVRGITLGELSRRLGFGEWVIISQHVEKEGGRDNTRILEDLFEAFLAAIFLDNGSDVISGTWSTNYETYIDLCDKLDNIDTNNLIDNPNKLILKQYIELSEKVRNISHQLVNVRSNGYLYCQRFIRNTFEKHIDLVKLIQFDDNYKDQLQTHFQKLYGIFPKWHKIKKGDGNGLHTIGVKDRCGFLIGIGTERKKTDAEQLASKEALIYLNVIDKNHGEDFFR